MKAGFFSLACSLFVCASSLAGSYTIIVPSGDSLIANHLNNPPNDLPTLLSGVPIQSEFRKWICVAYTASVKNPFAWINPNQTLLPGEGAIFKNPTGLPISITFNGSSVTPVLPLDTCSCDIPSLVSCQTTNAPSSFTDIMGVLPVDGTKLWRHNVGMPAIPVDNVNYTEHTFSGGSWTPGNPQVLMGEAVWVLIPCPTPTNNCCTNCFPPYPASYSVPIVQGVNFLVNHLCHGSNYTLDAILPTVPDGSTVQKWTGNGYGPVDTFDSGFGGWVDPSFNPSATTLDPGVGFVFTNPDPSFTNITFYGCEPNCPPPCIPTNGCTLVGRLGIGTAGWSDLSSCPPVCGTRVSIWNGTGFNNFDYLNGSFTPPLPPLPVGHSAFVCFLSNSNCVPCPCPTNQPPNDLCASATPISPGVTYGSTLGATPSTLGSIPTLCGSSTFSRDVWYTFTAPCPGGTVTLDTCLNPCPSGGGTTFNTVLSVYSGTCPLLAMLGCNDNSPGWCGTNNPTGSRMTFSAEPCVTYYIRVAGSNVAKGCFALRTTFVPTPTAVPINDECTNATPIKCNETRTFNTCMATTSGSGLITPGCAFGKDVWFKYKPLCSGTVSVDTCGSFFDTVLGVYGGSCNSLGLIDCNNNASSGPCAGGSQSRVTFVANASTTYFIRVGGTNGAACSGTITVIGPNPTIPTCPPTNCASQKQRLFSVVGTSTGNGWSWCLSSPCCFNISGTVAAGTVPAGSPASALVSAMIDSINSVCTNTAFAVADPTKFKIKVCICGNCPTEFPFVLRVGSTNSTCDDMCVVNSPLIASSTGPCAFNPGIADEPLSGQDCNQNGEDDTLDILNGTSPDSDENGVPDECPVGLGIAYEAEDNQGSILWSATDAILEQSANIAGPWDEVPGATSPHPITPGVGQEFFRLRLP